MEEIVPDNDLSPEDFEARKKLLSLAEKIQKLFQTDEGFREWYQEGINQIEAGQYVTFDQTGWHESETKI